MKKIFILGCTGIILAGCSFIDETKIEKQTEIPVTTFLQNESKKISGEQGQTGSLDNSGIINTSGSETNKEESQGGAKDISDFTKKTVKEVTSEHLANIKIESTDLTLSGTDTEDTLLKSTSDKDVENLINSLFDSVNQ